MEDVLRWIEDGGGDGCGREMVVGAKWRGVWLVVGVKWRGCGWYLYSLDAVGSCSITGAYCAQR